jgi:hypothetical protein
MRLKFELDVDQLPPTTDAIYFADSIRTLLQAKLRQLGNPDVVVACRLKEIVNM